MEKKDEEPERVETVVAALIYLMTHYARTGCPRLAVCVSRHMQCLAVHPRLGFIAFLTRVKLN